MDEEKGYIELVAERAIEAFWTSVSNDLPAITTGDMNPMSENNFAGIAEEYIYQYVKDNLESNDTD